MKPFPETPQWLAVTQRVVWFKPPSETLADPVPFLAHVMTYGTIEDLRALKGVVGIDDYRAVLDHAPPGVFDKRFWAYWHLQCGRSPAPPLPPRIIKPSPDAKKSAGRLLRPPAACLPACPAGSPRIAPSSAPGGFLRLFQLHSSAPPATGPSPHLERASAEASNPVTP